MDDQSAIQQLLAIEEIRKLPLLYARGIDRKDYDLLRTLYLDDARSCYGDIVFASADEAVAMWRENMPRYFYTGHHICNHLISVDGDEAEGEVYTIAYHIVSDGKGSWLHDVEGVRYFDRYRRVEGRWYFASRTVTIEWQKFQPIGDEWDRFQITDMPHVPLPDSAGDTSYKALSADLFRRGGRGDPIRL